MNKTVLITRDMMDEMKYDEEISQCGRTSEEMNNLKSHPNLYETIYEIPHTTREDASALIRNHLNELSAIESDQNCIPVYTAKRNIELGLKLISGDGMVVDDRHVSTEVSAKTKPMITITSEISIYAVIRAVVNAFERIWHEIEIVYDEPRKKFIQYLMKNVFEAKKLEENVKSIENHDKRKSYCSMFIFKLSDLNAALHHLTESFNDPIAPWRIGYIYVQESCYEEFYTKLNDKLKPYEKDILRDQVFVNDYDKTFKMANDLNASSILSNSSSSGKLFPIFCNEFDRDYFKNPRFSPIVIVKSVRTAKEAITLAKTDKANAASIWCLNHSLAYEIVNQLNYSVFWINCLGVIESGVPIKISDLSKTDSSKYLEIYRSSGVHMKNSYHFEYFLCNEGKNDEYYKTIIFPFGVTFAN